MKNFIKHTENFICAKCGTVVHGNGYTNHCPNCLWSKHVDNTPGDRSSQCNGMMEPIAIEPEKNRYIITHRCEKCGKIKRQRTADNDSIDAIIQLSSNKSYIFGK